MMFRTFLSSGIELGVLAAGLDELLLPVRELLRLLVLRDLGMGPGGWSRWPVPPSLLDHLVGGEDGGLGAEAAVLALGVELDDLHVLLVGLVVLLDLVE